MAVESLKRPAGLSIFFPALNDAGTIASLLITARKTAQKLTSDFEVIVVDDGSRDPKNRGYGGALRTGFTSAEKEFIFYTDGDAQYDPAELELLWPAMTEGVDLVNGYKVSRSDPAHRIVIGRVYHWTVKILFGLKVRDVDCDFRLMRRSIFERVQLERSSGVICLEMMKKITDAGFRIAEVPVHHYHRAFGRSQFFNFRRLFKTAIDVAALWFQLVIVGRHRRGESAAGPDAGQGAAARAGRNRS